VVQNASDLSFELVATADGATIYVEDHGKPMATAGMSGKLMVLAGANKTEVAMATVGDKNSWYTPPRPGFNLHSEGEKPRSRVSHSSNSSRVSCV
jgi:hypothetical protein